MSIHIKLHISNDREMITIEKIAKYIQSKGLTCQEITKDYVKFEKEGGKYEIFSDGRRFQLGLVYSVAEGTPMQTLLLASNQFNLEGCGVKASMNIDANNPDNNKLFFSVDGFCHRPKDFRKDFDFSMEALKGGADLLRTICEKIAANTPTQPVKRRIGFIPNYE